MARRKGTPTGRCQGCNHPERVRIERFLAAGGSIKGAARKFDIDYHALRRHWTNHVSAEARASYVTGAGATKNQLEEFVADESLGLIDHYRIVRGALYNRFTAATELGDSNSLALHPEQRSGQSRLHASDRPDQIRKSSHAGGVQIAQRRNYRLPRLRIRGHGADVRMPPDRTPIPPTCGSCQSGGAQRIHNTAELD